MYNAKIDELIEAWRGEMYETLKGWIAIDSPSSESAGEGKPFGENVAKVLERALSDAGRMGFDTRNVDGYAGEINLGGGDRTLGMLAHLDIVPAGEGWTKNPFGAEMENGRVYGRGTQDDKGPAVAALYAMRAVKEAGIPLRDGVRLILGTDEECGMRGVRYYMQRNKMPDYGFSPDADFPLINIEKGGASVTISAYSPDEAGARIPVLEMYAGERVNVVPGKAFATVGTTNVTADEIRRELKDIGFTVNVTDNCDNTARIESVGVSAHASMPHLGVNAIGLLFKALKAIGAGGTLAEAISAMDQKFGLEGDGASAGIKTDDPECGPLTCNMGLLRFDGRLMTVQLDIRRPLAAEPEDIMGRMAISLKGTPLMTRFNGAGQVHYVPRDSRIVKDLLAVYHDVTGLPAEPIAIGGGTYAHMLDNFVAFGICFPGDVDTCHMPDEYIDWEKFVLSVKIFAHAIEKLAGEE